MKKTLIEKKTDVAIWWNRELTLKCKLKCYLNPWITHRALALIKGNREPHEAKKKSFDLGGNRTHDLRIRSTVTLPTELRGRTEKVGELNINCCEAEIVAGEKELTIRDYRLLFLSRWATARKQNISLKMAEQLSAEGFTEFVDFVKRTIERGASVYHGSVHVGLEICVRKLEEHTRMLIAISLSKNSSSDLFDLLELSLVVLL